MLNFEQAVVYDVETFPNTFTLHAEMLNSEVSSTWEISHRRDDRQQLIQWFNYLHQHQAPMIGFNIIGFDYPIIHFIYTNPTCTVEDIYNKSQQIINSQNNDQRFGHIIWDRDRFTPQIDLFKINHFDNKAKTTSLKALQCNMRAASVVDMPVPVGTMLASEQIDQYLIPYNIHDVTETKRFAKFCKKAIDFRIGLIDQLGIDVMNYNDTKIGGKLLEQRIGDDICYDRSSGRKKPRQTVRSRIALADIIFPYIRFDNPEFARVLDWMKTQVLTPEDLEDPEATITTKGVFSNVKAMVGGIEFSFGTGGIHASVPSQRIVATDEWLIRDIDVASLYPSIAIVNQLAPAHLGEAFSREYRKLPEERKDWQKKKGKKCVEANSLKLAGNGTYGNSNNKFSVFYDPQFTMTITINGQLMLCMLAEWLLRVPTLQLIQANTDGITYRVHKDMEQLAKNECDRWQGYTMLTLEDADYSKMFIRDVNNYIAIDLKGVPKVKGAYWCPDPLNYADSISEAQPPAWHKDLGGPIVQQAAYAAMVHNVDIETFMRINGNPFDFMLRYKAGRQDMLMLGDREIQRTSRYYVALRGDDMRKIAPPTGTPGAYKRKNGVSEHEYNRVMATLQPGEWSEAIHTKNKSKYEERVTAIEAGWKVAICNDAADFDFSNVNYLYYVQEARKLLI